MLGRTNAGSSAGGLNFRVIQRKEKPSTGKKNDIWVCTDVKIPKYTFSVEDPYLAYKDVDLLDGTTIKDGYISTTGSITAQQAKYGEVYSENYISVKYGTTYYWTYTLSEKKAMWLAIAEYTGDKVFSSRIIKVSGVDGNGESGTYTPSKSTVTSVRISWRAYGDSGCKVTMTEKNVGYYPEPIPEGSVWFTTGTRSTVAYNALRRNDIHVYPLSAKQRIGDKWCSKSAELYDGTDWIQFSSENVYLYNHGDKCIENGGGWVAAGKNISSDGGGSNKLIMALGDGSMALTQSAAARGGIAYKNVAIDLTGISTINIKGKKSEALNNDAWTSFNVWTSLGAYIVSNRAAYLTFGKTSGTFDLNLDVSSLTGECYVGIGLYNTQTLTIEEVSLA